MIRDYAKVASQIEAVSQALEDAAQNNEVISIAKACKIVGVHQAWLYRVLNNIDDYKLNDQILSRLEDARDSVLSLVIQRLDDISTGMHRVNGENSEGVTDTPLALGRDSLMLKNEQWKLKNLLPKHYNDNPNALSIASNTTNNNLVILGNVSNDMLRSIAALRIGNNNGDSHE